MRHPHRLQAPVLLAEVDLPHRRLRIPDVAESSADYRSARLLIRQDGRPVGVVDLAVGTDGLTEELVEQAVEAALAGTVRDDRPSRPTEPAAGWPEVSVVVATRDRPELLRRCLASVLATGYERLEVLVVDNAPTSEVTRRLVQQEFPGVRYHREDQPGLGVAHNRALAEVSSPIVAFTDDDVLVHCDWITWLVAALHRGERVACATGLIWPAELDTAAQLAIDCHGGFDKGFVPRLFDLAVHRPDDPFFPYSPGVVGSGANMAFRTDVLKELGGFDPALGAGTRARGGDDLAAFTDVVMAGWTIAYEPAAVVYHRHRSTDEAVRRQAQDYGMGLAAHLTRLALARPSTLAGMARRVPSGLQRIGGRPGSPVPRELRILQVRGLARGPLAYLASRRELPPAVTR